MGKRKRKRSNSTSENRYDFRWSYLAPQYWLLWLSFALLWLITRLPLSVVLKIGDCVGLLLYKAGGSRRKIGARNIELCFPELNESEREAMLCQCFKHCGHGLFLSGIVWWSSKQRLQKISRIEGIEPLLEAKAAGENILMVFPHNTSLEICAVALAEHVKFNVLFRVNDNPMWEYVAGKGRSRHNVRLIPRKQVKEFLSLIETDGVGAVAPDQDLGKKRSVFVPFFGIQTATVPSVSDFAKQTNSKVAFFDLYMDDDNTFVAACDGLLDNFPSDDQIADTARVNALLEESVRRHPSQYLWLHRRFKTRPEGEPKLY